MQVEAKIISVNDQTIIIEYAPEVTLQFCKNCKDPSHFAAFIACFCPNIYSQDIDLKTARRFERRLYNTLTHEIDNLIQFETGKVAAFLEARFGNQGALTPETQEYLKRLEKDFFD